MKRLYVFLAVGCFILTACAKYKTFEEEAAVLNERYSSVATEIFKLPLAQRNDTAQAKQAEYETFFKKVAKKWKKEGYSGELLLSIPRQVQAMQEEECKTVVGVPFERELQAARVDGRNIVIASLRHGNAGIRVAGQKIGEKLALLEQKYVVLAKEKGCQVPSVNYEEESMSIMMSALGR